MKNVIFACFFFLFASASVYAGDVASIKLSKDSLGRPLVGVVTGETYVDNFVLAADTTENFTVPTGANIVFISWETGKDLWVTFSGTNATVPAADVTDGTGAHLQPGARRVYAGQTISLISSSAVKGSLSYYKGD